MQGKGSANPLFAQKSYFHSLANSFSESMGFTFIHCHKKNVYGDFKDFISFAENYSKLPILQF